MFDFTTFPTLTTPRLILRELVSSDAADLFAIHGDPEVQQYDSDPPMQAIGEAFAAIERAEQRFGCRQGISWGIYFEEEHKVVGTLGFYFSDQAYYKVDLGYSLARAYWRRGIMTEAVRAAMAFGFDRLGLHRINVDTRMDNLASVGLMRTLGFHPEGVRRECIRSEDGAWQSWGLFGMLEQEYRLL